MSIPGPVDFEIRPRFGSFIGQYATRVVAGGGFVLVAIAVEIYRVATSASRLRVTVISLTALLVVLLLIALVYGTRARIAIGGDLVFRRGWSVRTFARADVTDVVACRTGFNRNNRLLLLRGRNSRCLLALYADYWADTDLQALVVRLGKPIPDSYDAVCSAGTLRRLCAGGGLPLVIARPGAFGLLLSPVIIAVIVLVVQLFS